MAVLKMGSKGNDVENIQNLLNKAKAKPKLNVDGIFGKLTDKQTKLFQKKCKLKPDGKVGKNTLAALKAGGSLPEMTVPDFSKNLVFMGKVRGHNKMMVGEYAAMGKEFAKLSQTLANDAAIAVKATNDNQKIWDQILGMGGQLVSKQAEFETLRTTAPAKAEKLVKDCEKLKAEIIALGSAKFEENRNKAEVSMTAIRDAMDKAFKMSERRLATIRKNRKDIISK